MCGYRLNRCGSNSFECASSNDNKDGKRYPLDVLYFKLDNNAVNKLHPQQKPVELLEYLIRTYTNEGETVLDATMGSGSTGVACINTGRNFIGIEKDAGYYEIAQKRLATAEAQRAQSLFKEAL